MSAPRSLQFRLTLFYAAGIFAGGIAILAALAFSLTGIESTESAPGKITVARTALTAHQLLVCSAVAVALLVPIAIVAGRFVANRFLRPLRAITLTARALSARSLHWRFDFGEPTDELTALGSILDDLFARLNASFDAQRHFVANASHELRTPLAGLRTLLEVALADPDADVAALRSVCQEALDLGAHQERLVAALLTLATSERGLSRREPVDLAELAEGALASRRALATQAGITLAEDLTAAAANGDPGLIESLIANLVDNAVRHNHPGGHVEISTRSSGAGAELTVSNSGPFVPRDQVERLFQPFQRLAPDRHGRGDGNGLGLAIVDAVARAHRATLTVRPRLGGGLTVSVWFLA
jgi:signal transduction histidine kinase